MRCSLCQQPSQRSLQLGTCHGAGAAEFQHVLRTKLVPAAEEIFEAAEVDSWQLLMDKAPAHAAASTTKWLQKRGVNVLQDDWPGNSPDLNPIENVWGWMKAQLYRRKIKDLCELKAALLQLWDRVPDHMLTRLMTSMNSRLRDVVANEGGYTGR